MDSFFKPEFLNRFDSIIEFKALEKEQLLQIVDLMLDELNENLQEQQISFTLTDEVKDKLVELGYHPEFGARPLRRVIQEQLEDKIADYILDNGKTGELRAELENEEIVIKYA